MPSAVHLSEKLPHANHRRKSLVNRYLWGSIPPLWIPNDENKKEIRLVQDRKKMAMQDIRASVLKRERNACYAR
jgi:hypothetical protein